MKTVALAGVGFFALWLALSGNYQKFADALAAGDFQNAFAGRGEKVILGLIGASVLLWLIENNAGHQAASWYVFLIILGYVVFNRAALGVFMADFQKRLGAKTP